MKKGVKPVVLLGLVLRLHREPCKPTVPKLVQPVKDPWFEAMHDHAVSAFDLPVRPRVRHGCPIHADMVIIAERKELFAGELGVVVGDDGVRDPETVDYIGEKEHCLLGFDSRDGPSLNPLSELVNGDEQVGEAPGRLLKGPDKVQPLDREGPRKGDRLERLGRQMGLPSIVLAPFAGAYYLGGAGYGRGPVEALSECIPDKAAWGSVVATRALMNVLK